GNPPARHRDAEEEYHGGRPGAILRPSLRRSHRPRIDRSRLHDLLDIVAVAICAVVAGAESWDDIEEFGEAKHDWLKRLPALPNGLPSHAPFRRLFEGLAPDEFRRCFLGWVEALHEATEQQVIAIDGKALRRSFDRAKGKSALHLVHARATANHLLLGQ